MMKWVVVGVGIALLNYMGNVEKTAFDKGLKTSRYFGKYPGWNRYAEPLIVRQFGLLFGISNAFIQGMLSDNKNVKQDQENLRRIVEEHLKNKQ